MNIKKYSLLGGILLCAMVSMAQTASKWSGSRPDGHAPIHVMGDHTHKKGGIMVSYRYMNMAMNGAINGSNSMATAAVHENYMVAPIDMNMTMHMIGIMYAPSDHITIMAMTNYQTNAMNLRTRMGLDFATAGNGLGDIKLSALSTIFNKNRQTLVGNIGVSIPTGSIENKGDTPMMANAQLAYPMQNGSGTWDPFARLTYQGQTNRLSWGLQVSYLTRIGENEREYTLGDSFGGVAWGAVKVSKNFSASLSIDYANLGTISGADPALNPMMMPLFDSANSGRNLLSPGIGINYYVADGALKNFRVSLDFMAPIVQTTTGTQMEHTWMGTAGIQYAFDVH